MNLLIYSLNGFIILVILYFIYQSIVLPSIRESLSYKLFALRDDVRLMMHKERRENKDILNYSESTINNLINCLPILDFKLLIDTRKIVNENRHIQKTITKYIDLLKNCDSEEIREIEKKKILILIYTLIVNDMGMFIYIIPIAIIFGTYSKLKQSIKIFGNITEEQCKNEFKKNGKLVYV